MADQYHVDLSQYSMERYAQRLAQAKLMPGRLPLKEKLNERFESLRAAGIDNLDELLSALSTAKRRSVLAEQTGIPEQYLVLLRREANGMRPKPVSLGAFPEIDLALIESLAQLGIKDSRQLLAKIAHWPDCAKVAEDESQQDELWQLVQMSDLVRINGVGPVFARMLLAVEIDGIAALAKAEATPLYDYLVALNDKRGYTRARFTLAEMQTCIDLAQALPIIVGRRKV